MSRSEQIGRVIPVLPSVLVFLSLWNKPSTIWPVVVGYHVFCIVVPILFRYEIRGSDIMRGSARSLTLAMLTSALVVLVSGVVSWTQLTQFIDLGNIANLLRPERTFFVYSIVVNAFAEEWFWRGFMVDRIGILQSAFYFGLMHGVGLAFFFPIIEALTLSLPTVIAAVIWAIVRRRSESLWPCIITHAGIDAAILLAIFN